MPGTKISVRIPTVGEILEDESNYYGIISTFTASPFQYIAQLDNWGIDFAAMTDYELFRILFMTYAAGTFPYYSEIWTYPTAVYTKRKTR